MFPIDRLEDIETIKTRFSILYDSTYHIVLGSLMEDISESMIDVPFSITTESYIDGKEALVYTIEEHEISSNFVSQVERDPTCFVFENNKLLTRPTLTIELKDPSQIVRHMKDGTPVFKINTDIHLVVKYHDPDNIGFYKIFSKIKMKDRGSFIETPTMFSLEPETLTYSFTVSSAFPGIATLRAKDTMYLCYFEPFKMRFMQ